MTIAVSMSAFVVFAVQLEPATVHLEALTFGQVGEMLAGSLAAGWASMSRRANDTWEHLQSASFASLLGCWRWAPVFVAVREKWMDFWTGCEQGCPAVACELLVGSL